MSRLGDLIIIVGADIDGFKSAMKDAVDQIDYFSDEIEKRFKSIESVGQRLAEVGAGLTAAVTLPLVGLGTAALTTAAQFETTQIAFNTLSGSAAAASEQLAALYKFAAETPFEVAGVLKASRTLTAMQFAARDVIPVMRTLGDAASGLGLGQEGLDRLVFHMGQIKALGTIDGHILREMGQQGINAGQMLADALGKTVPEVMDMVHNKAIGATTAINALLAGMSRDFGGLMQNQSESLAGLWSNLKDNVTLSLVEIGNVLLPIGKQIVQFLMDVTAEVKVAAKWFADLPAPVQSAVGAFAAIAALAGPIMAFIGGLAFVLPPVIALISATSIALGTTTVALAGATAGLSLLLPLLVGFGVWISQNVSGVKAFVASLAETGPTASGALDRAALAFTAANAVVADTKGKVDAVSEAMKTLRLNASAAAAQLSDPKAAWAETHKRAVEEATKAVQVLTAANARGAVSADVMAAAQKRLATVLAQKMPDFTERTGKESTKLTDMEKEHAKEIDGELAHTKALLAIETDRINFRLKIGEIGDAQAIDQLNQLAARELDAERDALERKKLIYHKNLAEKQAIDNLMAALADKSALVLQQAEEKGQEHQIKSWDKYLVDIKKTFSETTKEIAIQQGKILKTALDIDAEIAKLGKVKAEGVDEGNQHAIAMRRLADERDYALQIGKTAESEIAYAQQMLEYDRQESAANVRKLQQEKALETDAVRRGQIDNQIATAKNQANEHEYASLTRIRQLQQQNTAIGRIQIGLWNTFNNTFSKLSQGIASAIIHAKSFGSTMLSVVQSIGQEILQTLIGAALGALQKAISQQVAAWLGLKAVSSAMNVAEVGSEAAVGGAAAFASTAAIPIIGPALAPAAGAAAYAAILGTFGPLAAFEKGGLVPETMLALVHKGEWVTPAAQVAQGITGPRGNGGGVNVVNHFHGVTTARDISRAITRTIKLAGGPQFSPAS